MLWNGSWKVVVPQEKYNTDVYPTEEYTPIGVVVVPASHMYDGKARMMALRWMTCDDPENGSLTYQQMFWGTETDLSGLTNYAQVPIISSATEQEVVSFSEYAYLPSDYPEDMRTPNPQDPGTGWFTSSSYIASPYNINGMINANYRATSYSGGSLNNPLSYFDGRHQTDVILAARGEKDYKSWKPDARTLEDYPPASCCDMYHTVGTSQGDWYLPSCAELGYINVRKNVINNAVTKVNGMQGFLERSKWSSSECNSRLACFNMTRDNMISVNGNKNFNEYSVIAFAIV